MFKLFINSMFFLTAFFEKQNLVLQIFFFQRTLSKICVCLCWNVYSVFSMFIIICFFNWHIGQGSTNSQRAHERKQPVDEHSNCRVKVLGDINQAPSTAVIFKTLYSYNFRFFHKQCHYAREKLMIMGHKKFESLRLMIIDILVNNDQYLNFSNPIDILGFDVSVLFQPKC